MATFFLLAISTIVIILLCKIVVLLYNDYITRKMFRHFPALPIFPFFGTLATLAQTEEGRLEWFLSLLCKFKEGIFVLWRGPFPSVYIYKPEMIKAVLSSTLHINKSKHYVYFKQWMGNGLLTSEDKQWARDRKLLSPSVHFNALEQFSLIMSERTEVVIKNLEKTITENQEKAINIVSVIDNLSLDIVFDTIMGIDVHSRNDKAYYIQCTQRLLSLIEQRVNRPWMMADCIFKLTHDGKLYSKLLHDLHEFTRSVLQKKQLAHQVQGDKSQNDYGNFEMTAKTKKKALLELLLNLNDNEDNLLSDEEIRSQIDTFMFAAYDTTSTTLVWALFCLGNNLEHQEKLHEEIDMVFQDSEDLPTMKQLSQLKYLERVMKESIRLYPTVPLISRNAMEDINIGGYTIPKNTTITVAILLLHRDPKIWSDPLKFDPDRFLPENTRRMHPYAFIPFSAGPRNCIGQRFALLEEKIILTSILRKWRIKSVETPAEINLSDASILRPYEGTIHMHFSPKK